jgi:hypothetical protein
MAQYRCSSCQIVPHRRVLARPDCLPEGRLQRRATACDTLGRVCWLECWLFLRLRTKADRCAGRLAQLALPQVFSHLQPVRQSSSTDQACGKSLAIKFDSSQSTEATPDPTPWCTSACLTLTPSRPSLPPRCLCNTMDSSPPEGAVDPDAWTPNSRGTARGRGG